MANRPSRLVVPVRAASFDGRFWGRYPNGDKPDTGAVLAADASGRVGAGGQLSSAIRLGAAASDVAAGSGGLSSGIKLGASAQDTASASASLPSSTNPVVSYNFDSLSSLPAAFDTYGGGVISTEQAYGGSGKSVKCTIGNGATDANFLAGRFLPHNLGQGDEIWVRFRTFFPTGFNFDAGSGNLKFFRIDHGPGSGGNKGHGAHIDWYVCDVGDGSDPTNVGYWNWINESDHFWYPNTGDPIVRAHTIPTGIVRNTWQTWNFYYKLNSVASSGRIRLWRDSTLIVDTNVYRTLGSATNVIGSTSDGSCQGIMFVTYWNGGSPQAQSCYVDDWTIYDSITGAPSNTDSGGRPWIGV